MTIQTGTMVRLLSLGMLPGEFLSMILRMSRRGQRRISSRISGMRLGSRRRRPSSGRRARQQRRRLQVIFLMFLVAGSRVRRSAPVRWRRHHCRRRPIARWCRRRFPREGLLLHWGFGCLGSRGWDRGEARCRDGGSRHFQCWVNSWT
jgi:hypothetical protein